MINPNAPQADPSSMHAVAAAPAPSTPPAPDLVARRWFNPPDSIRRIRRARFVAATNGGLLAAGAFVSLLLALGDPWSAVPGLVLAVFAFFEFQGRAALARLDPSAPRRLAINQIALGIVLGLYFSWRTIDTSRRPPTIPAEFQSLGDPELDRAFAESWRTMLPIMIGAYATVAIGSLIACGLNAWYYASRRRWVLEARNATTTPRPHGAA